MTRWTMVAALTVVLALAAGPRAADGDEKKNDRPAPGQRPGGFGGGQFLEAMFKRLDADGDGKLTRDEIKKAGENRPDARFNLGELLDRAFDRLDADKDGVLSLDEFKKFGEQMRDRFGGQIDPERLKQLRERFQNRKPPQNP